MKNHSSLFLAIFAAAACVALQTGCQTTSSKSTSTPAAGMQRVGSVAFVNQGQGFVLVETDGGAPGAAGTAWVSRGPGGEADLKASGQSRKPFTVADIVGGSPERGDTVYQEVPAHAMAAAQAAAIGQSAGPTQVLGHTPEPEVPDMR